jgi:DNA-binding transcriptional regulator YdaS (Cro superfamily)
MFRHFGSAKKLADYLGISTQAVSHWKRIPAKYVYALSQPTGIHPYKLRPDIYIESFWMSGMDTAEIAKTMFLTESEVYKLLSEILERRRHKPNANSNAALPPIGEPPVESGERRESIQVPEIHGLAQGSYVGAEGTSEEPKGLRVLQTDTLGGKA